MCVCVCVCVSDHLISLILTVKKNISLKKEEKEFIQLTVLVPHEM